LVQAALPPPDAEDTFLRSKLDLSERSRHLEAYKLHHDLLRIRRTDPVIAAAARKRPEGAVISHHAFVLRYAGNAGDDRLLVINLGRDLDLTPVPEPLLAPPKGGRWETQWSSEAVGYGGLGTRPLRPHSTWHIPGEAAVLLRSEIRPTDDAPDDDR
jgi:maltooligosyltrehalose trehalohydrolase